MRTIKIRFHLGRGDNFQRWQIKDGDEVRYFDPIETCLVLKNTKLTNKGNQSNKIFNGANKTVTAWIECQLVSIQPNVGQCLENGKELRFNPRQVPHWTSEEGENADGREDAVLYTFGRKVYAVK